MDPILASLDIFYDSDDESVEKSCSDDLLTKGTAIDKPDEKGWYPIHCAAYANHVQRLDAMFEIGKEYINVNWQAHDGSTALLLASGRGHLESTKFLLEKGADPNLGTIHNWTPLLGATMSGNIRLVQTLLDAGASVTLTDYKRWTPLHEAAMGGFDQIVRLLLAKGADLFACDDSGATPAFIACVDGRSHCLQVLIDAAEDKKRLVNGCSFFGLTCVGAAASAGNDSCMKILMDHGANVNIFRTIHPIYFAVKGNHTSSVQMLLPLIDHSLFFNGMPDPVFLAVKKQQREILEMLLGANFSTNRPTIHDPAIVAPSYRYLLPLTTRNFLTPLALAVTKVDLTAVRALLRHGAAVVPPNYEKILAYSPLLLAVYKRRKPEILVELLKTNPHLNMISPNSLCRVPDVLLMALRYSHQLRTLLKAGLNPALEYWCRCKRYTPRVRDENYVRNFSLLEELRGELKEDRIADLISLLLPFSACGLPNCCDMWANALGPRMKEFEKFQVNPQSLMHACRVGIRRRVPTGQLSTDKWVETLPCFSNMKDYFAHSDST